MLSKEVSVDTCLNSITVIFSFYHRVLLRAIKAHHDVTLDAEIWTEWRLPEARLRCRALKEGNSVGWPKYTCKYTFLIRIRPSLEQKHMGQVEISYTLNPDSNAKSVPSLILSMCNYWCWFVCLDMLNVVTNLCNNKKLVTLFITVHRHIWGIMICLSERLSTTTSRPWFSPGATLSTLFPSLIFPWWYTITISMLLATHATNLGCSQMNNSHLKLSTMTQHSHKRWQKLTVSELHWCL